MVFGEGGMTMINKPQVYIREKAFGIPKVGCAIHLRLKDIMLMVKKMVFGDIGMTMINIHLRLKDIMLMVKKMGDGLSLMLMVILFLMMYMLMVLNSSKMGNYTLTSERGQY